MPTYRFRINHAVDASDDVYELPDRRTARDVGIRTFGEVLRDGVLPGKTPMSMEIREDDVCVIMLTLNIDEHPR